MHLKLFAHGTKRLYKEPVMLMVTPAEKNLQLAFKDVIDSPDYDDYDIVDYKDWTVGFGKKFNSIKFYVVFNYFGLEGMQEYARLKVKMGEIFE